MTELFETVLVANRGEIARRVLRTLRRLGIRSVAVYSDADAEAPHVHEADEAVRIGPASAAQSYLDIDAVLGAAQRTGAQAVHPGYGFLSENAAFAEACDDAGIVFIGPGSRALEVMADKIRAKAHVAASGVPTVPGFSAAGMVDDDILDAASRAGYPLLIKPSAGGGGKGMQVVRTAEDLPDALAAARRIARASFGDDTLLLERLIERPRHIEVQVLADTSGRVIHLGERECTLQRRHQKVIEEAPSPVVDDATRRRLGEAACAAAASVDYRGAGTVEFLVAGDRPDAFFFIEMNTRLQVEHPVTELVTGVDLVEQQIRIAAQAPLLLAQDDIRLFGHAVEARIYAEDPTRGFLPATGIMRAWSPSADMRTDSAIESGSSITADYDPLIAKVIASGEDRESALRSLDSALAETVALGVETNIGFLRTLLADPHVRSGDLDTGLIDRLPPWSAPVPSESALLLVAHGAHRASTSRSTVGSLWSSGSGWRAGSSPRRAVIPVVLDSGEIVHVVDEMAPSADPTTTVVADDDGWVWMHADGHAHRLRTISRREAMQRRLEARGRAEADIDPNLTAPMPGAVVAVHVDDGSRVAEGDRVLTIEAMKMEQVVVAPHAGVVELDVAAGDQVRRDQVVARIRGES